MVEKKYGMELDEIVSIIENKSRIKVFFKTWNMDGEEIMESIEACIVKIETPNLFTCQLTCEALEVKELSNYSVPCMFFQWNAPEFQIEINISNIQCYWQGEKTFRIEYYNENLIIY